MKDGHRNYQNGYSAIECIRSGHGYHTFEVNGYEHFLHNVAPVFSRLEKTKFVWRGVRDPEWQLHSSLSRSLVGMNWTGVEWKQKAALATIKHLLQFMEQLRGLNLLSHAHNDLYAFLEQYLGSNIQSFLAVHDKMSSEQRQQAYELLSLGQHYGLATPFLDWSYVPAIALFFAFQERGELDDGIGNRVVYALSKTAVEDKCPSRGPHGPEDLVFLWSMAHDNKRIVGQAGLFTYVPAHLPVNEWVVDRFKADCEQPVLLRFLIRNENRAECLKELDNMNINARGVFPDKLGASEHANYLLEKEL